MRLWARIQDWIRAIVRRSRTEDEMDAELRFHLDARADALIRAGLPRADAERQARVEFGGLEAAKDDCRESRGLHIVLTMVQDAGYGFRALRKSPTFTVVALLMLALGIGANTAIFSVVNAALLRPLSYRDPSQLFVVREIVPSLARFAPTVDANLPDYQIWRRSVRAFADVAIAEPTSADLSGAGDPEVLHGVRASANLLDVLGVHPAIGRAFRADEDDAGRGRVVILTDGFWRARFQGDASVIGRTLVLDGVPREIVGVLPASFRFPAAMGGGSATHSQDFFEPLDGPRSYERDLIGEFDFTAIARLQPGATPERALAELDAVQAQIGRQAGSRDTLSAVLLPLDSVVVGSAQRSLLYLVTAVGAVLLIVCVNLACLLLARVPARMREAAIRASLGASRRRIFRQMLTETAMLSFAGGALGAWGAHLAVQALVRAAPPGIPRLDEAGLDIEALLFTLAISIVAGVLFGILPAWRLTNVRPLDVLKATAMSESRQTRRVREGLVAVEVALTAALLISAGLLVTSLQRLLHVDAGFASDHALVVTVSLPATRYNTPAARLPFYDRALETLSALPGVRATGWITLPPLYGDGSLTGITIPGAPTATGERPIASYRPASAGYFVAMGIPVVRGRTFDARDTGRPVVVISQSVADRFWPGLDPIGRTCVTQWGPEIPADVIGVVSDVRTVRLDREPRMMVYVPSWFNAFSIPAGASFVLRTTTDPAAITSAARDALHRVDADVPVTSVRTMDQVVDASVTDRRFQMLLAVLFGAASLGLAALGIFGVAGYSVEQRRRELGIRMALGADAREILGLVLRQGMRPVAIGLVAGLAAAAASTRLMAGLLFDVSAKDPTTFLVAAVVLAAAALVACYLPARRALGMNPVAVLKQD